MGFVNLNGTLFSDREAVFKPSNRSFRYGDAVFETIRVVAGRPLFVDMHYRRMCQGAETIRLNLPPGFTVEKLEQEIAELLKKSAIFHSSRVRLTLYRNDGGWYTPLTNNSSYCIEAWAIENESYSLNEKGLKIDIYDDIRKTLNKLAPVKSANGLLYVLAGVSKTERSLDECIILNEQGNIAETISANIFIIFNGVFYTPSLNQGCIPGVMREVVIGLARKKGIEVQECPLGPGALLRADEVLLTNVISGITWVGAYKQKRYFKKVAENLTDRLNELAAKPA